LNLNLPAQVEAFLQQSGGVAPSDALYVIIRLDAEGILNALVTDSTAFGLTDVTTACVTPGLAPFTCQSPDEFLYWDGIHPTKAVHAILAQETAAALFY